MAKHRIGGSFAPRLTPEKLARYKELADLPQVKPETAGHMRDLIHMVEVFYETPESTQPGKPHPVGIGTRVPLEDEEINRIFDVVPWKHECEMLGKLFDKLPMGVRDTGRNEQVPTPEGHSKPYSLRPIQEVTDPIAKEVRDACFHLLWYAHQLTRDYEPWTQDKLPSQFQPKAA